MKLLRMLGLTKAKQSTVQTVERVDTCIYPWTTIGVDEHGGVRVCGYPRHWIGTLQADGLEPVWNGAVAQQLRWFLQHGLVHPVCQGPPCLFVRNSLAHGEPAGLREAVEDQLNEEDYLLRHPDVCAAIERGEFKDAKAHYFSFGRKEGRLALFHLEKVRLPGSAAALPEHKAAIVNRRAKGDAAWVDRFDDSYYCHNNPDAETQVRKGVFSSGLEHFLMSGGLETERPFRLLPKKQGPDWCDRSDVRALRAFVAGEKHLPVPPLFLVLTITTRCNLRCVMCPHGTGNVPQPCDAPVVHLDYLAGALPSLRRVELVGVGEPLLASLFQHVLETWPFSKDCYVRANTNGQLLSAEKSALLIGSGLRELSISIDAARSETYARVRGGDLDRLLPRIRQLTELKQRGGGKGPEIWINMIVMRLNVDQCCDFIRLALDLKVDGVELSLLALFGDRPEWIVEREDFVFRYEEQTLRNFVPEARQHIREALVLADKAGLRVRTRMYSDERKLLGIYEGLC